MLNELQYAADACKASELCWYFQRDGSNEVPLESLRDEKDLCHFSSTDITAVREKPFLTLLKIIHLLYDVDVAEMFDGTLKPRFFCKLILFDICQNSMLHPQGMAAGSVCKVVFLCTPEKETCTEATRREVQP